MNRDPLIPYAHQSIEPADIAAVSNALSALWITRGPQVEAFEKAVADYCGAKYAVAFNSATSALNASCFAAQVGPSDRVITTPNSFIASVGCAVKRGATPVFVDIDSQGNIDLDQLAYNVNIPSSRGKPVIIPVHFAGPAVDMNRLDKEIANPEAIVIEDASHAIGSSYYPNGPKVGSCEWSAMTVFSFHPAKTITTGEGGMVTTNDEELCHRLKIYRNNGIEKRPDIAPWFYEVQELTDNHHLTEFQAALGLSQFSRLELFVSKRFELMEVYRKRLEGWEGVTMLNPVPEKTNAYHLCVVQIDFPKFKTTRTEVMQKLLEKNIGTQVHYIPLYRHPVFVKKFGDISEYFPKMEAYYSQALSLPLYYSLTIEQVHDIVDALKKILSLK